MLGPGDAFHLSISCGEVCWRLHFRLPAKVLISPSLLKNSFARYGYFSLSSLSVASHRLRPPWHLTGQLPLGRNEPCARPAGFLLVASKMLSLSSDALTRAAGVDLCVCILLEFVELFGHRDGFSADSGRLGHHFLRGPSCAFSRPGTLLRVPVQLRRPWAPRPSRCLLSSLPQAGPNGLSPTSAFFLRQLKSGDPLVNFSFQVSSLQL